MIEMYIFWAIFTTFAIIFALYSKKDKKVLSK